MPGICFVRRFQTTANFFKDIVLFRIFIILLVSFGNLFFCGIYPFHLYCKILLHNYSEYFFIILIMSSGSLVVMPFSLMVLIICVLFILISLTRGSLIRSFQWTSFGLIFIYLVYTFSVLLFLLLSLLFPWGLLCFSKGRNLGH